MNKCRYILKVLSILIGLEATQSGDVQGIQCGSYISYNVSTDALGYNRYLPYHVALHRCQGDVGTTSPRRRKCVASTTDRVNVTLKNLHTLEETKLELSNETSCKSACTYGKSSCSKWELYDEANCNCDCPDYKTMGILESICPSGGKRFWDSQMCTCDCKEKFKCTSLQHWDEESCGCKCLTGMKEQCESMQAKFDQSTCACVLYFRTTEESDASDDNTKSISMNSFVVGLLVQAGLLVTAFIIVFAVMSRHRSSRIENSLIQKHEPYMRVR